MPYRDFWLLYGPLSGMLVAVALFLVPPTIGLLRAMGLATVALQAAAGYYLVRDQTTGLVATSIAVLAAVSPVFFLRIDISAWSLAMAFALASLAVAGSGHPRAPLLAGLLAGLTFLSRLDVGAYVLIALLLVHRRPATVVGFMAVAVPASVAALLLVPADALFEQLVWFPVVGTQLYRALSLDVIGSPPAEVLGIVAFSWVPRAAILVTGVLIATGRRPGLGALAVFAALCQLQTLGRADLPHIAQAATPALLLTAAWFPAYPRHRWLWSGGLAGLLAAQALFVVLSLVWLVVPAQQHERDLGRGVQRILAVTGRNDPIFVGLTDNRYTHANPLIVYYLADRKPGTRLTMYNPGITNTEPHQRSMVRDLIRSGTSLAVLDSSFALLCEPENLSCRAGSRILDDFLETTFTNRERLGDVIVASSP